MKFVQNIFDQTRPLVEKDGKRNILYPLHNALETMAFVPDHTAHSGAHVRDAIDLKRTMVTVIFAMVPALLLECGTSAVCTTVRSDWTAHY